MSEELDDILDGADEAAEEAFDLSDIEAATPGALAAGRYLCQVVDCKRGVVKTGDSAGQPKFAVRFKPLDPPSNKLIFMHANLTGKGAPFTKSLLIALGVDMSQPVRPSVLMDKLVYLHISVRKDRPTENEVDTWEPYDGDAPSGEADEADLK